MDKYIDRSYRNQKAAISRLPPETLGNVFELSQQHAEILRKAGRKDSLVVASAKTEVMISQVNRHWRDVAVHSPLLWTHIDVSPYEKLDAIAAYLKRSEKYALDVHFAYPRDEPGPVRIDEAVLNASFDLIIPHVHRWKSVTLAASAPVMKFIELRLRFFTAPLLQRFHREDLCRVSCLREAHPDQCLPTVFLGGTPILSSVDLVLEDRHLPFCCPSLGDVKNLSAEFYYIFGPSKNYGLLRKMLAASPSLETLDVGMDGGYSPITPTPWSPSPFASTEMPRLHSIRIRSFEFNNILETVLLTIEAPQLHSLTLQLFIVRDISPRIMSGIHKFTLLRSLSFIDCDIVSLSYRKISQSCPTVTHLSFGYSRRYLFPGYELLRDMDWNPSEYQHWSNLDTISVNIRDLRSIGDVLCEIVCNQIAAGHPLRKLCLDREAQLPMRHLERLLERVAVEHILCNDDI